MHRVLMGLMMAATSLLALPVAAQWNGNTDAQTVRCESTNNRTQRCNADTRGGVRLARQLSDAPCVEGRSWGARGDAIWVSGGCRGEFQVGNSRRWNGNNGNNGRPWRDHDNATVQCESVNNRRVECPANTGGGVQLMRKLSDSSCDQGRDWGYTRDRVWVSNGCRAQFAVGRSGHRRGNDRHDRRNNYGDRTLRCESVDRNTVQCPADTRGGVQLLRKLSDNRCTEGETWGYSRDRVWVSRGCRAEFQLGGGRY